MPGREELIAGLRQRADMKALAAERESAVQMRKLAGADLKPTVAFTGSLQYQQDGLSQFWNGDNRSFQAGLAIKMPLFSAPKVPRRRAAATAREQQAAHAINATLDSARLNSQRPFRSWLRRVKSSRCRSRLSSWRAKASRSRKSPTRTASSRRLSSTTRACRCFRPNGRWPRRSQPRDRRGRPDEIRRGTLEKGAVSLRTAHGAASGSSGWKHGGQSEVQRLRHPAAIDSKLTESESEREPA